MQVFEKEILEQKAAGEPTTQEDKADLSISGTAEPMRDRKEGFMFHWEPVPPRILLRPTAVTQVVLPRFEGAHPSSRATEMS